MLCIQPSTKSDRKLLINIKVNSYNAIHSQTGDNTKTIRNVLSTSTHTLSITCHNQSSPRNYCNIVGGDAVDDILLYTENVTNL